MSPRNGTNPRKRRHAACNYSESGSAKKARSPRQNQDLVVSAFLTTARARIGARFMFNVDQLEKKYRDLEEKRGDRRPAAVFDVATGALVANPDAEFTNDAEENERRFEHDALEWTRDSMTTFGAAPSIISPSLDGATAKDARRLRAIEKSFFAQHGGEPDFRDLLRRVESRFAVVPSTPVFATPEPRTRAQWRHLVHSAPGNLVNETTLTVTPRFHPILRPRSNLDDLQSGVFPVMRALAGAFGVRRPACIELGQDNDDLASVDLTSADKKGTPPAQRDVRSRATPLRAIENHSDTAHVEKWIEQASHRTKSGDLELFFASQAVRASQQTVDSGMLY